ncbi:MAG TPA: type II toxin-antitoxin system HicA family toxin [Candidatus Nitrosotalea sp.]|nr:type II toxin-antitoxin system HicA family toxin [Candidatus Nitrosotalea sp.]
MGKLRVLSGREVCRILQEHGFVEVRRRGSHIVMQRRTDAHPRPPAPSLRPRLGLSAHFCTEK